MKRKDLVKVSSSCPRWPSAISRGSHNCKRECSSFTFAALINYPDTPPPNKTNQRLKKLISSYCRLYTILVGKSRQGFHIGRTSHLHSNVKSNGHLLVYAQLDFSTVIQPRSSFLGSGVTYSNLSVLDSIDSMKTTSHPQTNPMQTVSH